MQHLTYSYRLKDKHQNLLIQESKLTNIVWNYCNVTQKKAVKEHRPWLTEFDFNRLLVGSSKEFKSTLLGNAIQQISKKFVVNRQTAKKPWLRFRGKKSLGWVPCQRKTEQIASNKFKIGKLIFECLTHRNIPKEAQIIQLSFNQNVQKQWFLNVVFKIEQQRIHKNIDTAVGIDLGLKTMATLSDGQKFEPLQSYRKIEKLLGQAQKANKKKLVKKLHKYVKNQRKDYLHKLSNSLCRSYEKIYVGDVNSTALAKTKLSKSVLDVSWSTFRYLLSYKSIMNGGKTIEVPEKLTTQTCSYCGGLPSSRPRGIAGLRIREWKCNYCGVVHDRDTNAAKNILRIGQDALVEGAQLKAAS